MIDIFKKEVYREAADGTQERDWARESGNAEARRTFRKWSQRGLVAGGVVGSVFALSVLSDHEPAVAEEQLIDKQTKHKHRESFTVKFGEKVLRCTIADKRYEVVPGDNLWTIAEDHNAGVEVAPAWLGTMDINSEALVEPGNYDLILPEQRLKVLAHCALKNN